MNVSYTNTVNILYFHVCSRRYSLRKVTRDLTNSRRPYLGLLKMMFFSNNPLMLVLILLLLGKSSRTALMFRRENIQTWLLFMKHDYRY